MKKITKQLILLLLAAASVMACKKKEADEVTPNEFRITENFTASKSTVDFSDEETVVFSARFNQEAAWTITIVGQDSEARKTFSGTSSSISNIAWIGTSDGSATFAEGENAVATLSVKGQSQDQIIEITGLRGLLDELLVESFENGANSNWTQYHESGADMLFAIQDNTDTPYGTKYYQMSGNVDFNDFRGYLYLTKASFPTGFSLANTPDDIYFNVSVYLPNDNANDESHIKFRFIEDENDNNSHGNESVWPPLLEDEDAYFFETARAKDLEPGQWHHFSVKYAEMQLDEYPAGGGNNLHEPNKLFRIDILLMGDKTKGYSSLYIDNIVFTTGAPLH